jgi:hypothetical protein
MICKALNNTEDASKRPKLNEMTIEEHWQADTLSRVNIYTCKYILLSDN